METDLEKGDLSKMWSPPMGDKPLIGARGVLDMLQHYALYAQQFGLGFSNSFSRTAGDGEFVQWLGKDGPQEKLEEASEERKGYDMFDTLLHPIRRDGQPKL